MAEKTIYERSAELHKELGGKLEVCSKRPVKTREDLSLMYTPGVAEPCRIIAANPSEVYNYTWKKNTIAVVSDGTAVLGLGNIGPYAAMPVMEGKAALFKDFGGVNAVPICLNTTDWDEIIRTIRLLEPGFGGFNIEDIGAPGCVYIEEALQDLGVPVFHDDQHGTAIVVAAGLINSAKVVGKKISDLTVVVSGAGAAGSAIIKMLNRLGVKEIYAFWKEGIITAKKKDEYDFLNKQLCLITNHYAEELTMEEAMTKADVFIGVSIPNRITPEMVASMEEDPIVFAMANPEPEIPYDLGKAAGAMIMATGRSDSIIQVNNVSAFPGVFRGALDCGAFKITDEMKLAAVYSLAGSVPDEELSDEKILPDLFNTEVVLRVAKAVADTARKQNNARF